MRKPFPKCKDCGKELHDYRTKRCHRCSTKFLHKKGIINNKGKNNWNWKGGMLLCGGLD